MHDSDLWFDSPRQLLDRLTHGPTEVVQFLSIHSSVKGFTYFGAGQPKLDIIGFVGHRILIIRELGTFHRRRGENVP